MNYNENIQTYTMSFANTISKMHDVSCYDIILIIKTRLNGNHITNCITEMMRCFVTMFIKEKEKNCNKQEEKNHH